MPIPEKWQRKLNRHPRIAALVGALAILAVLGGAYAVIAPDPLAEDVVEGLRAVLPLFTPIQWFGLLAILAGVGLATALLMALLLRPRDEQHAKALASAVFAALAEYLQEIEGKLAAPVDMHEVELLTEELTKLKELRDSRGVRALRPSETGLELHRVGKGVFAFVDSGGFSTAPRPPSWRIVSVTAGGEEFTPAGLFGPSTPAEKLQFSCVSSGSGLFADLEVHRHRDGSTYLIGFASGKEGVELESAKPATIWLYTRIQESVRELIEVPVARVRSAVRYSVDGPGCRLELQLSGSSDDPRQPTED